MRYISTRGETAPLRFQDAVLTGLAPDGGLLLPTDVPSVANELDQLRRLSFKGLAKVVMAKFADDIPAEDVSVLVDAAYASFDCPETVHLRPVGQLHVLELFHGPTLAFKDIALQLLGRLFAYILERRGGHLNILGATSGDTGSAAIAGVRGLPGMDIFMMYPNGRISPLQQLQMTTVADANVHCLAIQGSFDTCQGIMKRVFGDLEFKRRHSLGAVNSVNWARVLAQVFYYAYASLRLSAPASFCVPTGNFGNVFAGFIAKRMGFPINRLIVATNENDILSVFFASGLYRRGQVRFTISPSMDIQVASNFERFLYYHLDGDVPALKANMANFQSGGEMKLPAPADDVFAATSVDNADTLAAIRSIHSETGYLADPHTAVGLAAARRLSLPGPVVCLATAHPAKFPAAVNEAVGALKAVHPTLEELKGRAQSRTELPAGVDQVKAFIAAHAGPQANGG